MLTSAQHQSTTAHRSDGLEASVSGLDRRPIGRQSPNVGRAAMIGATSGFAALSAGVTVAGILGGLEPGSAFGFGVWVGFWGGGGFGFMLGATLAIARHTDAM